MKFLLVMGIIFASMFVQNILQQSGEATAKKTIRELSVRAVWMWVLPIWIGLTIVLLAITAEAIFWVIE
jgi:hypothetical protein